MKFLIAGLGNIGDDYERTRHNIGFDILDHLAGEEGVSFSLERHAFYSEFSHKGRSFHLIKPTTYMNLSGKAVRYWLNELKLTPDRLLVVTDDIALPLARLRMRKKGSDGGHNGLKNIQDLLGTNKYPRLRFGVGNEFGRGQQVNYVLGRWSEDEWAAVQQKLPLCAEAIKAFGTLGVDRAMNFYNNK